MRFPYRWAAVLAGLILPLAMLGMAFTANGAKTPAAENRPPGPRLVVLLLFDQLRGDYLERWDDLFNEDGFHRLEREGAWFQNCHYPYAHTVTAAGHGSVGTGCSPNVHGIADNDWYERETATRVNCVAGKPPDRYERVPPLPGKPGERKKSYGVAPDRLLAPALGDAFMDGTGGKSRIVSLSFKDRGAVLFAGHQPNADCFWFDSDSGSFVTSTYYRDRLPDWVKQFNAGRPADAWFGKDWTRLRPDLDYEALSGPDDVEGEGKGVGTPGSSKAGPAVYQGRVFPHRMTGGLMKPGRGYYDTLYNSPFGNDLLLQLAKRAIDAEQLGQHNVPDLLCISFSCNDSVGHTWGPDSQEVLDMTLRTDRLVGDLLNYLDDKVGEDAYVVGLTADHGVCPLPEVAKARGKDAGRIDSLSLGSRAQKALEDAFGKTEGNGRWIEATSLPWFYLNYKLIDKRHLKRADVENTLARWLEKQTGIQKAYTASELRGGVSPSDQLGQSVLRSYYPGRSGDVVVIPKPNYILHPLRSGTTHGTPHEYDTHVPLLVCGPGISAGVHSELISPQALPVILCEAADIKAPAKAQAVVPAGIMQPAKP
ncbi:MAG: alkaline phosphatase family protein [Gemmataceae bacterium]